MRIGLSLRAFWTCLFDRGAAERVAVALENENPTVHDVPVPKLTQSTPQPKPAVGKTAIVKPALPEQNPAITLLAALQRDARLIDLVHENLDQYNDGQIGAAARPCLKQCRTTLERLIKIERLLDAKEQETISIDPSVSPGQIRWVGEAPASATSAKVVHPGWRATQLNLPQWTGKTEDAQVIAPAQIQSI